MLDLRDKRKNMPGHFSCGQQQRVAIARTLITKPAIILAEEPDGNLDSQTSADASGLLTLGPGLKESAQRAEKFFISRAG